MQLKKEVSMTYYKISNSLQIDNSYCEENEKKGQRFFIKLKSSMLKLVLKLTTAKRGGSKCNY